MYSFGSEGHGSEAPDGWRHQTDVQITTWISYNKMVEQYIVPRSA
jgi:hypothetical protein